MGTFWNDASYELKKMNENEPATNELTANFKPPVQTRRLASLAAIVLTPTLIFYIATLLVLGALVASMLVNDLEQQSKLRIDTIAQFVKADIQQQTGVAGVVAELFADNVDVASAITASDESQIVAATSQRFAELKSSLDARGLSFYRLEGKTASLLVHVHDPSNQRGNSAVPQAQIDKAVATQSRVAGIEIGVGGIALRAVAPAKFAGHTVGYSEVSVDFQSDYLDKLKQLYKTDFRILLKAEIASQAKQRALTDSESPGWLVATTTTPLSLARSDERLLQLSQCKDGISEGSSLQGGNTYLVQSVGLADTSGTCVGSLQILLGDGEKTSARNVRLAAGLAVLVVVLLLGRTFLYWVIRRQTRALHLLAKISHGIAAGAHSNVEQISTLKVRNYETFVLADALQKMTRQLLEMIDGLERRVREKTADLEIAKSNIERLNQRLEVDNVRMSSELNVQHRLQQMLQPNAGELKQIHRLDVAAEVRPATEVGGDYYDLFSGGNRDTFAIGDVTGHGLESGVVMLMTQSILRGLLTETGMPLTRVLDQANQALFANIARSGIDRYLSLCLIDYAKDPDNSASANLTIVGQHETILIARASGDVEVIDTDALGFPVGMVDDISAFVSETRTAIVTGDVVLLYSDGVTEAENTRGIAYGTDRLGQQLLLHRHGTAAQIKRAILDDLLTYCVDSPLQDDVMLVVLKQG